MTVGTEKKKSSAKAAAPVEEVAAEVPDLEVILPEHGEVQVGEYKVRVRRIKSREFFALMRIITKGLGEGLASFRFSFDAEDPEQMQADMLAVLAIAIPEAIEEVAQFLKAITEPVNPSETAAVAAALENPEVEVTMDILGVMLEQERDDIGPLLGKAQAWITRLQKTMARP